MFSLRAPTGFKTVISNLCEIDGERLRDAPAREIEELNMGEDLVTFEHLVLDAAVHLDARADTFLVSVLSGSNADTVVEHEIATLGEAARCFEEALQTIWDLEIP